MDFRTELFPQTSDFKIDYSKQGLMLGSCFVENIGAKMENIKLPIAINPLGIIYNPASIAASIERIATRQLVKPEELFFDGHLWRHYSFHSRFCSVDKTQALELMNTAIERGHRALQSSSYVILTLGTAHIYRLGASSEIVSNCHKTPQREFVSERLNVEQASSVLLDVMDKYLADKQVVVTVSPIRHIKDGFEQNSLSKATLILAAHRICQVRANTTYFPSYEIMMDDLRDYRFYSSDMVHPSLQAVDYIWQKFAATMFSEQAVEVSRRVEKITQALSHRPFNPDSDAHRAFVEKTKSEAESLCAQFPMIRF